MKKYRELLNISYQRAISPDYHGFFEHFYQIFAVADQEIEDLFINTDMDRQYKMLMQSMSHLISYSTSLEPSEDIKKIAAHHGKSKLDIPAKYYDIWLESLIMTLRERDPLFDKSVEKAWREVLAPGISYMKSYCS